MVDFCMPGHNYLSFKVYLYLVYPNQCNVNIGFTYVIMFYVYYGKSND